MLLLQILFWVGVVYGPYCLLSFLFTCFFRTFVVLPIFTHAKVHKDVSTWKDAYWWGFYELWEYMIAVLLWTPYKLLFFTVFRLFRINLAQLRCWTEKERHFFTSTPKQLLQEWIKKYFEKYYSTEPQK